TELGEASRLRDEAERERAGLEQRFEQSKEAMKEEVLVWQKRLRRLTFGDEAVRATFAAIRAYGPNQGVLEPVRAALQQSYADNRDEAVRLRLAAEQRKAELLGERERLLEEKKGWEQSREPEPKRSEARISARTEKLDRSGAPLYAVCDFQPHAAEEARARVEEALERSGLLDAWISPDGRYGGLNDWQEEAWIMPNPIEFGFTLADVLVPSPSEESGLTAATIDAVLRTFLWEEGGSGLEYGEWSGVLAGNGEFRLGPLAGKAGLKPRAEYIGKETRKRTRMLEIARLADAIAEVELAAATVEREIGELQARERTLQEERDAFPDGAQLQHDLRLLQEAGYRLEAAMMQEERALERFKAKSAEWRELQRELVELTAGWSRLKRERELQEALIVIRDYESAIGDLHSAWRQYRDAGASLERIDAELANLRVELEDEEALADELDERRRSFRAQVETLRRLIEDLGLADVARRLGELRAEEGILVARRKAVEDELELASDKASRADEQLKLLSKQVEALRFRLDRTMDEWRNELKRGLVAEWRDKPDTASSDMPERAHKAAKELRQQYEGLFAGRNVENVKNQLLEQFNAARMLLTEYILQTVVEEATGRILVLSMRDHTRPQPPFALVEELERLEEEQGALLSEKDRELYEEIILRSVGKAIRQRIHRAEQWVRDMNKLMEERNTSSGLRLKLEWEPKPAVTENQLDTAQLVELLKRDSHRLREDEIDAMIQHFRDKIGYAKQNAQEEQESLRKHLYEALDYRNWFEFGLKYRKGEQAGYRPLTDARFNVLSGGEKAMAMYIPLFAATWSRYSDARPEAPRLISLDEAFAGVDDENMRDMFKLLTDMGFDYMMTSQVLWGCFDSVPKLAIYEIYRPKDVDFVTLFRYRWNGKVKEYVQAEADR
ncbi:TIGR02680 family protein, partial [Paenibacillus darwinianus]